MATVILLRHGRSSANTGGVLAGRAPDVHLDEVGHEQVARAAERVAMLDLAAVVSSPLERCQETAAAVVAGRSSAPEVVTEDDLTECDYGQWQGGRIADLAKDPLWKVVQAEPSRVTFPGGESMTTMQERAVAAVRHHDRMVEARHGADAVWVAVSHGDVIKSVLADALDLPLDRFQRLNVGPSSMSVVRYSAERPDVLAVNTLAGDLGWLARPAEGPTVGGGRGT